MSPRALVKVMEMLLSMVRALFSGRAVLALRVKASQVTAQQSTVSSDRSERAHRLDFHCNE